MLQSWVFLSLLVGLPLLWAWWQENEAGRMAMMITLWGVLTWREAIMIAPYYDRIDSTASGLALLAALYANGWLAWFLSNLPRYWRAQRKPRRPWQAEFYESFTNYSG